MRRTWVEVSLERLRGNVQAIRAHLKPGTGILAVVKANAYGLGVGRVSRCLADCGISEFVVATLEEAIELRRVVGEARILVLGGCLPGEEEEYRRNRLTATILHADSWLDRVPAEVKIDTGMGRLGIPWDQARDFLESHAAGVEGVYSHFAGADCDAEFTRLQLERFLRVTGGLPVRRHLANSAGLRFAEAHLDAVRPGLLLYGIAPCQEVDWVEPALVWKSRILSLRRLPAGTPVGYGGSFTTSRESVIGTVAVGYADGYNRRLSNRGQVRVRGRLCPVVGRVTMDLIHVDLTDLDQPRVGEEVVLIDDSKDSPLSVAALARALGTIPWEVLTWMGPRVERVYRGDSPLG